MSLFSRRPTDRARGRASVLAAAGAAAAVGAGVTAGAAAAATGGSLADEFAALRQCESSGNYSVNTGNGYYGAYQFDLRTWRSVGGSGYPHQASPATQDRLAYKLYQRRGWQPWPACSDMLGLSGHGGTLTVTAASSESSAGGGGVAETAAEDSPYQGVVLSTGFVDTYREDVAALQTELRDHGYSLVVDGLYGPVTRATVIDFQQSADIVVDGLAGPQTFGALF